MNINMALIRRRFALGTTAALMSAALVLSACGGDEPDAVVTTPAAEAPAADAAATPEAAESEEAEDVDTEVITETEVITDTDVEITVEETLTETEVLTTTEVTTDTDVTTDTEVSTDTTVITDAEGMTDTEGMTDAEGIDAGAEMTATDEMTDTEAAASDAEAAPDAAAASMAGISGAENAQVYATTLLDYNFENADGEVSGEIEDLYIDMATGQVLFTQIEYGGFLDIGDTELSMPLNAFKIGEEGELVLNFDEATLEGYPDMGDDWPNLEDPAWDDDLNTFWSDLGIVTTGDYQEATTSVVAASNLIGRPTADIGGGDGTVEDIVIDLGTGKATYAVIAYDAAGAELTTEGSFVVPFSAINLDESADVLSFRPEVNADVFNTAPRLDRSVYAPGQPLDPTWRDDFDTFWGDLGFDIDGDLDGDNN